MLKSISLLVVLSLSSLFAFSQTEIYGTWDVHCSLEQTGSKAVTFCDLCFVNASDTAVKVEGFTLKVDSTHLQIGNSSDKISYIRRPSGKAITFVKDRKPYSFDILTTTSSDHLILRSSKGNLLFLQRRLETVSGE